MIEARDIHVKGIVQGVGFRPFVYRLAHEKKLCGWVLNATEGVFVHAEGQPADLDAFVLALANNHPAAAVVEEVDIQDVPLEHFEDFSIRFSQDDDVSQTTLVSPDLATCDECVDELFDSHDRRYRYPFINCTNCGPRFTIMSSLPYDRPATSMAAFTMCSECQSEYENPLDRRFHAQPDACFVCGPHVGWLENSSLVDAEHADGLASDVSVVLSDKDIAWAYTQEESDQVFARAANLLHEGGIVAVKGLGGYHLVCDAYNQYAIAKLRLRKKREGKAFAVMVANVDEAKRYCLVSEAEEQQLTSPARPIVLLKKRPEAIFAPGLADDLPELGVMLPTTPVQHLLLHDFDATGMLVMTSGNIHDEPIVTDNKTALESLRGVADAFLVNDRDIISRYDDSVMRILHPQGTEPIIQVVRRARGLAPVPISISCSEESDEIFATGPEQKNTMTFTRKGQAFVSQHIGDMESAPVFDAWLETKRHYQTIFRLQPQRIMYDKHPEYLTTKWAYDFVAQHPEYARGDVQHHHAHILSVMGEHNLSGPVCGVAFDGTGYGVDEAIWGGEVLLSNLEAFERFANFAYIPLPSGAGAIKHPLRTAYGALWEFDLLDHPAAKQIFETSSEQIELLDQMIDRGINTPMTSSVGRLFDAASALLGICDTPRYEGEAAILLEAAVHEGMNRGCDYQEATDRYTISVIKNVASDASTAQDTSVVLLDPYSVFEALLDDLQAGIDRCVIARRFHDAFVQAIVTTAELVRAVYDISIVALSGGVFMNRYLIEQVIPLLQQQGFTVALNKDLPPNDACISYGQAVLGLQAKSKG